MKTYTKEDPSSILQMFNQIAKRYDRANDVISFGLNRVWNRKLIKKLIINTESICILDLCCGTGDTSFSYLRKASKRCKACLVDFSSEMLECAKEKASRECFDVKHELHFLQSDVQSIALNNQQFDYATVAYGIRNVKDIKKCVQEVYRLLKPGGRFGILELTLPPNFIWNKMYGFYLNNILPSLGRWVTKDPDAYRYLCRSIQSFIEPTELLSILENAGFRETEKHLLLGGIATIFIGKKQNQGKEDV